MSLDVARVVLDLDVPHLDHPFEYLVPEALEPQVAVGSRVQVNFQGRRTFGYVVSLEDHSTWGKKLLPIQKVIGPFPLLTSGVIQTAAYLANRYGSSVKQLLSFALPTRRAHVEKKFQELGAKPPEPVSEVGGQHADRKRPRSVATLFPLQQRVALRALVEGCVGTVVVVMPTAASVKLAGQWLMKEFPEKTVLTTTVEDTDAHRYRVHLQALTGQGDVFVGTRSQVWTPLPLGGTLVVWDSADPRLEEQRAPYLDALDVAVARAHVEGVGLHALGYSRSLKEQLLLDSKWALDSSPRRADNVALTPKVHVFDWVEAEREGPTGRARLPQAAFALIRQALEQGPVLVQVAGPGGREELMCATCGQSAVASGCAEGFHGPQRRFRVGADAVADELARAFPNTSVNASSSSAGVISEISSDPQIVVATSSAEPYAPGGYAGVVVTDADSLAYTETLDGTMHAMRRWMNALGLSSQRAQAIVVGTLPETVEQALVRWDPQRVAQEELQVRQGLGFPPAAWVVQVDGDQNALEQVSAHLKQLILAPPAPTESGQWRLLLRAARGQAKDLMGQLRAIQWGRSAAGESLLRIVVNPQDLAL